MRGYFSAYEVLEQFRPPHVCLSAGFDHPRNDAHIQCENNANDSNDGQQRAKRKSEFHCVFLCKLTAKQMEPAGFEPAKQQLLVDPRRSQRATPVLRSSAEASTCGVIKPQLPPRFQRANKNRQALPIGRATMKALGNAVRFRFVFSLCYPVQEVDSAILDCLDRFVN